MQVNLRTLAVADIDAATDYYLDNAGRQIALGFVDALEAALSHLCEHPLTGSLQFAYEVEIPELRSWPVKSFPYLVFYVPEDEHIDVWRVLHAQQDLPAHLSL